MEPSPGVIPPKGTNNVWYHVNGSTSVIVFVHGILSDSRSCWLYDKDGRSAYWPYLVTQDVRLPSPAVFLGGFYTAIDAGAFDIPDCTKQLMAALRLPDIQLRTTPLEHKRIVFICHSAGGIVVRYMLAKYPEYFKDKEVGLLLMASPSIGAKLADIAGGLAGFYNNQLALHLKWKNDVLKNLDDDFKDLLDRKVIPYLTGIEACENHFILHRKFLPDRLFVVDREAAGRYFSVRMLENTDHSSIVKPATLDHPAHKLLVEFWLRHYGVPLEARLMELLELSKQEMRERNLPYFTPSLFLALLHENGFTSSVLNSVRPGSAKDIRSLLRRYLDTELPAASPGPFQEFDWFDRDDVRRAQKLASDEGITSVSERILAKSVLLSPTGRMVSMLKDRLAPDFENILSEIERRRTASQATPGM